METNALNLIDLNVSSSSKRIHQIIDNNLHQIIVKKMNG